MNKHTPGPWFVQADVDPTDLERGYHYNKSGDRPYCAVVGADGNVICDNCEYYPAPMDLKNAALISAAPDLLEALDKIMDLGIVEEQLDWPELAEALAAAGLAIAKARGGS